MLNSPEVGTSVDSSGIFNIGGIILNKDIILDVSCIGYETKEITISGNTELANDQVIQLNAIASLGEVVVVTAYHSIRMGGVMGGVIIKKPVKDRVETKPLTDQPMIKVYPNPVASGTNINVGCQKLAEGYYSIQLINQSGQQIFNRQTWIDAEAKVLNIDIPAVAAGIYF